MGPLDWMKKNGKGQQPQIGTRSRSFAPDLPARGPEADPAELMVSGRKVKDPGEPFQRGDRIIADQPFLYGGKANRNPETQVSLIPSTQRKGGFAMSASACLQVTPAYEMFAMRPRLT